MIRAKLFALHDEREHGTWNFAALPAEGQTVVIRINDAPVTFRVMKVVHAPVLTEPIPGQEGDMPYVSLGVERFEI